MSMNWSQLLSHKRLGSRESSTDSTTRTDFQRDLDRIVFSSAFRRMQDKTQIFPLSKIDYVRTRLTHSLESSSVGRSLGTLVGEQIIARHRLEENEASDFGDICAAACLAHDIGNPPFGHSGEDAIRHWAENGAYGKQRVAVLQGSQREDFLNFEGNSQGFRVLTRLQNRDNPGGLQLTCATLAAFTKYPRESCIGNGRFQGVSAKKPGFTAEDQGLFTEVADSVGLLRRDPVLAIWHRHPLAFLVEAADDICYRVIDIEDGYRLGHLSFQEAMELFVAVLPDSPARLKRLGGITGDKEKIEFLRAKVISQAISEILSCFLDHEEAILGGRFDQPLMSQIPHRAEMDRLIEVANDKIYIAPEVIEIETAGFQVISELLERFIPIVDDVAAHGNRARPRSQMMIRLIPEQFIGAQAMPAEDDYTRLLRLTDFVSGMTDSYAVSLYKKVTGISLPG
ncbi:MAG: deoxyguanosinetriphosphate triphosphohydrolase [gamma proteobacterium symbiont of Ctena orbiculata]|uniref:Deoxyguanosinetriphosphate triphosphohydrolase n=1 Tax=Candidatus Thiodiazotropha taylori TaxID=2792791 RepID=A0A944QWJ1_9GAMM|nr:deoxyguanosinetriphosphate triphosphohydrolase [Candidatus Thiodiazotropha taylori]PUB85592.1 MAG: deoxyguanosinetriphosphate triphosphohydrolase [gamma proteobacterium symbiont of Ctena orbiculata]MBT2991160.1 deoxyguanosinetriphosphate triphosphohydrolase [Candidatus Thiodiazotropha taylori]MBT2998920.1 deoxyguanosinetriphosphate triphosphohydrolase [Candidatus Thiodiazotropha taylori]MBT3002850.1 deoxyguanosinetriphosphate triphosphohydrolase [Candidatus Thiodiazotropha taylori]